MGQRWKRAAARDKASLQRRLRQVGTPLWALKRTGSMLVRTGVVLYALNAGVQSYRLAHSDAFQARYAAAENGVQVLEDLAEDQTFGTAVRAYVEAKALLDPDFAQSWEGVQENLERAEQTRDQFYDRVRSIYDPLWALTH